MTKNRRNIPWPVAAILLLIGSALALVWWNHRAEQGVPLIVTRTVAFSPELAGRLAPGEVPLDLDRVQAPEPFAIRRGQTLGGLLREFGLEAAEAHEAVVALEEHIEVRRLRAGEQGEVYFDPQGRMTSLALHLAGKGKVALARDGDRWRSSWQEFVRTEQLERVAGELESSLILAVEEGGGPVQLAYAMSRVLQWDLDFNRDLRVGDHFQALFTEVYLEGDLEGVGDVLALIYENRGRRLEAYRYRDGYYDAEGRPLQKMFLRSPLPFTRVTSRFSRSRFHPVLKTYRPHYGVDYGAPTGTPVRATANGVVDFVGRNGGAGKMVRLRHGNGYQTNYLHLSRYAKGLRRGQRVSQGDLVGYVGSTGLSTGPHLDYRVKKNGRWINPLSLQNTPSRPVPASELPAFQERRDALRAALEGASLPPEVPPTQVARREAPPDSASVVAR